MKLQKSKTLLIALSLIFTITTIASGVVFAQGWNGPRKGMRGGGQGYSQQAQNRGPVLRTEMFNARIQVMAELTDQSEESLKTKLRYKPMWAVMDEYKVDYSAFDSKFTEKRTEIIKQAVADGKITQERADFMLQRAEGGKFGKGGPGMRQGRKGKMGQRGGMGRGANDCPRNLNINITQ